MAAFCSCSAFVVTKLTPPSTTYTPELILPIQRHLTDHTLSRTLYIFRKLAAGGSLYRTKWPALSFESRMWSEAQVMDSMCMGFSKGTKNMEEELLPSLRCLSANDSNWLGLVGDDVVRTYQRALVMVNHKFMEYLLYLCSPSQDWCRWLIDDQNQHSQSTCGWI